MPLSACVWFVVGGFSDVYLKKTKTPARQLAATLADFVPESIALGAAFATGNSSAYLLAALIALKIYPRGLVHIVS